MSHLIINYQGRYFSSNCVGEFQRYRIILLIKTIWDNFNLLMVSNAFEYSFSSRSNSLDRMLTCSRVTDIPVLSLPLLQLVKRRPGKTHLVSMGEFFKSLRRPFRSRHISELRERISTFLFFLQEHSFFNFIMSSSSWI